MLRTVTKLIFPLTLRGLRLCTYQLNRCYFRDIHFRKLITVPSLVQPLNQKDSRKMSSAITNEMHLPYEEFVKLIDSGKITIIDVRNPDELQESGKIQGSINIPLKDLKFALEFLSTEEFQCKYGAPRPKLDSFLVFHCRSGGRSLQALQIALDLGYKNAKHYKGGFSDWLERTSGN